MIDIHPDEKIILTARKHWFTFFEEIVTFFIAILIPVLLAPLYSPIVKNAAGLWGEAQAVSVFVFFVSAWILFAFMLFFIFFTNYYLDLLIITNKRVIDIEQVHLFTREIVTAALPKIEDVKVEVHGFVATFLKFGDIHIQTAATNREIMVHGIRHPEMVKQLLEEAYHKVSPDNSTVSTSTS